MGFGLPRAIGAANRRTGEAARWSVHRRRQLQMNIQELATLAAEWAQRQVVLMNNNALGLENTSSRRCSTASACSLEVPQSRFREDRRGLRRAGVDLDLADNRAPRSPRRCTRPGPCLIHATIDRERLSIPMGAAGCRQHR